MNDESLIEWDIEKNKKLQIERGLCFEMVINAIENNNILDDFPHPQTNKYPNQRILVIKINNYACCVPYVQNRQKKFLKTMYHNRILQKKYLT